MSDKDSLAFSKLSQTHIKRLKDAFQMIDDDGDGAISQNDLDKVFRSVGKQMKLDELQEMISTDGGDNNEGVTFPEFLSIMGASMGKYPEDTEIVSCLKVLAGTDELNVPLDELLFYLKEAGFTDAEKEFERLFREFTPDQGLNGGKMFKGKQFMNTISE
ncbi:MLC2 (YPR188C) [Zygosaccharomyces parabailii]|uniref:ZYBA0S06-07074g1_1 n=1 Tax=Zygosaccharomyces bailii (strain CLIB 213 / ATCC 58445 / CBS 680 / BCRC 21525 / NBRC 1098 / NCYC 1416 / NRRL Y-2227) TaxID=1333698 RepID=A0A8J2T8J9_ZYGB2|nr:MLC2 (YPR188C) [Zygosaccharomyces parabailii]CDF90373.1 ZYBA0S06-07074g1_1 [Zygosaccharomyces bailii CLIB 213]CDH16409.1 related to Myosin light chain 2 [Zygosaccharomyces bailii ISA1307]SJM88660.1 related to Myosin light chain 2 [Zygosaccharomyces bailii]